MASFVPKALVAVLAMIAAQQAGASERLHCHHYHDARAARIAAVRPVGRESAFRALSLDDPYNPYAYPGAANRAMTRRNREAPGVTNELSPDAKSTASGGPPGGIPGFDGS